MLDELERWWESGGREILRPGENRTPWRASNAGWAIECPRRLVYQAIGAPQDPAADLELRAHFTFSQGDALEDVAIKALERAGLLVSGFQTEMAWDIDLDEGELGRSLRIVGHRDLRWEHGGASYVVDIKGLNHWVAKALYEDAHVHSVAQANSYAFHAGDGPIARAGLFVIDKMQGLPRAIEWDTDERLARAVDDGFAAAARDAWGPAREEYEPTLARGFEPNHRGDLPWQCGYCPWARSCWEGLGVTQSGKDIHKLRIPAAARRGGRDGRRD